MSGLHIEGTYQTGQGHTLIKMFLCQMLFQAGNSKGWQSSKSGNQYCWFWLNLLMTKGSLPQKKRDVLGIFPKSRIPRHTSLETPVSKNKVWFILRFRSLGPFLVFTICFGAFGIWVGSFGAWDGLFHIWNDVYWFWEGVFGVWKCVFGVWEGGRIWYLGVCVFWGVGGSWVEVVYLIIRSVYLVFVFFVSVLSTLYLVWGTMYFCFPWNVLIRIQELISVILQVMFGKTSVENIARIANAVPVTLYSRVTKNASPHHSDQMSQRSQVAGSLFDGVL